MNRIENIDDTDKDIMRTLQMDARMSQRSIAEALDSSTGTVSQRVQRLTDVGAIKRFAASSTPRFWARSR